MCYECDGALYISTRDILWEYFRSGADSLWFVDPTPIAPQNSEML